MDNVWARCFAQFFREWCFKSRQNPRTDFLRQLDFEGFKTAFFHLLWLSFVFDGLFTTSVYSRRRDRFVNSAFPNNKNLAQKSKCTYDKQIWKQIFFRNSTFQFNRKKNRELRNRRLSHDAAAGSHHSSALPSHRNLNLRFVVKTTTLVRAAGKFSRRFWSLFSSFHK